MSLEDALKDMRDELAAREAKGGEDAQEEQEEVVEAAKEAPEEEEKPEEKVEEPEEKPKAEEKKAEEPEPDANAYQRMRREAAAAKKRAEEAEARLAAMEAKKETPQENAEEQPERQPEIAPEILEVVQARRMEKAEQEFTHLEQKFKVSNPEYEGVATEYVSALAQSIKIQNPRYSTAQVMEKTKETILLKAAGYLQAGYDPIEEMFHEAKDLGFTGASLKKQEVVPEKEEKEDPKPDMKKLAANRAKSTGMTGASGRSQGQMTPTAAADLTVEQFGKLSKAEKAAIYAQL